MPSPQTLLPWIIAGVIGVAGILQGLHWRSSSGTGDLADLKTQLRLASEENEMLRRENESLRSLAQGGGEVSVPQELIDRAEKECGLRYLSSPILHRIAAEELRDRISAAIESRLGPSGIDDRQESYKLIGWLRADDDLLEQLTSVRAAVAGGWFDDVTGEGWVTDRFDLRNIPEQAVLMGILSRILLFQHFPSSPSYPGDDAARAREALHQGVAAGSEARFYAASALAIGFLPLKENSELKQLMASLSPFMQGLVQFPNVTGKAYSESLYVRGNDSLQSVLRSPPLTTYSILFSSGSASDPKALGLPSLPEEPFLTETAGALGLRLWLVDSGAAELVDQIAMNWKNDRYLLFPDGEESVAVLWDIELENASAADKLEALALKRVAALAGQHDPVLLGKAVISSQDRHIQITRPSATRIRFLNTAEAVTAEKLGGE
ncbi:MAG: hypothetical protein JHC76_01050 [Akkermansiaceae bacterium]|nr:hypothetical protein [Akkermansiaceae bacterium]